VSKIVGAIFGEPDVPQPDPAIGEAAKSNSALGKEALEFNKDQFYNYVRPRQEKQDVIAEKLVNQQMGISDKNELRADEAQGFYKETFQPIERKVASDAMDYDSPGRIAQQVGLASTDVKKSFDGARASGARSMAMMGINPNSGRFANMNNSLVNSEALATADAMTKARTAVVDKGISLRAGAANFGRNMPNTAASAYGSAVAAGSSASGIGQNNNSAAIAGLGVANQGYTMGMNGNSSSASILSGLYGNQVDAYKNQVAAYSANMQALGSVAGAGIAASSKDYKTDKQKLDTEKVADDVSSMPVEKWKYKDGIADGGEHVGPYAEDFSKKFGGPKNGIDMITANGVNMAAIQGTLKKVERLTKEVKALKKARATA
jgi:hypothetical protein